MKDTLLLILALILPLTALAETKVLPSPGLAAGVVKSDTAGKWVIFAEGFTPVVPQIHDSGKVCIFEGPAGRYAVLFLPPGEGQPEVSIVILGGVAPAPPQPPGPVIPPGPEPPVVPPTPAGPRTVLILRESAEDTPALARLYTSLQAGAARKYLVSKGHGAFILDDDAVNSAGEPAANVTAWKAALALPLPALAILDKGSGKVLFKKTLLPNATAEEVLAILKEYE